MGCDLTLRTRGWTSRCELIIVAPFGFIREGLVCPGNGYEIVVGFGILLVLVGMAYVSPGSKTIQASEYATSNEIMSMQVT